MPASISVPPQQLLERILTLELVRVTERKHLAEALSSEPDFEGHRLWILVDLRLELPVTGVALDDFLNVILVANEVVDLPLVMGVQHVVQR